jgi:asparagine synthase (glutamine-hydrolysing)
MELRADLEKRGHQVHSRCDTEVLLRGYQEWGIDALVPRLRGMFAFAVWDHPRGVLTLVRDRLGVKPLAYCVRNGEIAFASTVAALRAAGFGAEIDPQAVLENLAGRLSPPQRRCAQKLPVLLTRYAASATMKTGDT